MAVRVTIDPERRLVEAVVEGDSDVDDFVKLLDAVEAADAVSYRKFLDVRGVTGQMHGRNMPRMAERIAAYRNAGPFAVLVLPGGPQDGLARLFVLIAEATKRGRVFRVEAEAREWLEAQPPGEPPTG